MNRTEHLRAAQEYLSRKDRWEYLIRDWDTLYPNELTSLGKDGWELICIDNIAISDRYIFKRKI